MRIEFSPLYSPSTEFGMADGDLTRLEIRRASEERPLFYFYDTASNRLITDFVLEEKPRVALLCQVTLVEKGSCYSPRIRLWKKDKSTRRAVEVEIPDQPHTRTIKATVATEGGHENFWKLIAHLQSLVNVDVPQGTFRLTEATNAELAALLASQEKSRMLAAVQTALGASLTEQNIAILAGRKIQVERFRRLLEDPDYFTAEATRLQKTPEAVWQDFFEKASWIFGYGFNLVTHASLDDGKLERITTGASLFVGGGKRIDAIMRTRAVVSSLLFCEIKRHDTHLLEASRYREPDIYRASKELSGGTAQLQKTVRKAYRSMISQIETLTRDDGSPTGLDFSTTRPRQVLLIGNLREFRTEHGVNGEKMESFELYRKSLVDVEILTFDELHERAKFIVQD